jgi:hypothetical protein
MSGQSKSSPAPDDDALFANMLASEMRKISTNAIKRRLKKKITDLLFEAQEEEEKEMGRQQEEFASFFLSQETH